MGLHEHLHDGEGCQLSWPRRVKIALSIACVQRHMHTELQPPFIIAVLTSSSVYLAEDFAPKCLGCSTITATTICYLHQRLLHHRLTGQEDHLEKLLCRHPARYCATQAQKGADHRP